MRKLFMLFSFSMMILCGCTDESEEVNTNNETTTGITTRAVGVVVWEAQPGTVDIPFGQAVTIGLLSNKMMSKGYVPLFISKGY
mgnify:CR=1 FL=1